MYPPMMMMMPSYRRPAAKKTTYKKKKTLYSYQKGMTKFQKRKFLRCYRSGNPAWKCAKRQKGPHHVFLQYAATVFGKFPRSGYLVAINNRATVARNTKANREKYAAQGFRALSAETDKRIISSGQEQLFHRQYVVFDNGTNVNKYSTYSK